MQYMTNQGCLFAGYQVVEAGLATHLVSSQKLGELEEQLVEAGNKAADSSVLDRILSSFQAGTHYTSKSVLHPFSRDSSMPEKQVHKSTPSSSAEGASCSRLCSFLPIIRAKHSKSPAFFAGRVSEAHRAHWPSGHLARHK